MPDRKEIFLMSVFVSLVVCFLLMITYPSHTYIQENSTDLFDLQMKVGELKGRFDALEDIINSDDDILFDFMALKGQVQALAQLMSDNRKEIHDVRMGR